MRNPNNIVSIDTQNDLDYDYLKITTLEPVKINVYDLMDEKDIKLEHQLLQELSVEEIGKHPYFYNQKWNQALNKNCVFLK